MLVTLLEKFRIKDIKTKELGNHLNTTFRYAPDQCQPEGREETMLRCGACGPFVHHHPLTIYLQDGSRFWHDFFGVLVKACTS